MGQFWQGTEISLRLFKQRDKVEFFFHNEYCCYMHLGHLEWERYREFTNFEQYFAEHSVVRQDHQFSLIITKRNSDQAIGMIQVYDHNQRNGTFYLGVYIIPKMETKSIYLEAIDMVKRFMIKELRYQTGYCSAAENQFVLLEALREAKYPQIGRIKQRYYQILDQYLFHLDKEVASSYETSKWTSSHSLHE